jgi:hypothetical protein
MAEIRQASGRAATTATAAAIDSTDLYEFIRTNRFECSVDEFSPYLKGRRVFRSTNFRCTKKLSTKCGDVDTLTTATDSLRGTQR